MTEQIKSGVELMFAGMGIVFIFLTMLVFAINLMSAFVQRYFPTISVPDVQRGKGTVDKTTVAAISAAVHQYRSKYK
jgi:oxaloacetate decarboxylase gamma subunit